MIEEGETHEFSRKMNVSWRVRMKQIFWLGLPFTISSCLDVIIQLASFSYSARLHSAEKQSGLGLSIQIQNVFGLAILFGLAFGYDALASQAIGAQNYRKAGKLFNKASIIILLVSLLLSPIFIFSGNFLRLISVEQGIADAVNTYQRFTYIPNIVLKTQTVLMNIHMKAQRITWPNIVIGSTILILHIGQLQVYTAYLDLDFEGIALAALVTFTTQFVLRYLFMHCCGLVHKESLQPFSRQDFTEWRPYLAVACPIMMSLLGEWASFEVMNLSVTYLGAESLAAQAILSMLLGFFLLQAAGFGIILTGLIGNSVGEGDAKLAKKFAIEGASALFLIALALSIIFYFLRQEILGLFAATPEIQTLCEQAALFLALESLFDQLETVLSSVLRGLTIVKPTFLTIILVQWGLYVPIEIGLVIITLKSLPAIWIVQGCAMVLLSLIFLVFLMRADWEKIAMEVHLKMKKKSSMTEDLLQDNRI